MSALPYVKRGTFVNTADVNSIFIGTAKNRTIIIDKLLVKETVEE